MIRFMNLMFAEDGYRSFAKSLTASWFKKLNLEQKSTLEDYYPGYSLEAMIERGTPVGLLAYKAIDNELDFHVLTSEYRFNESKLDTLCHLRLLANLWQCKYLKITVLDGSFPYWFAVHTGFSLVASKQILGYTYNTMRLKV